MVKCTTPWIHITLYKNPNSKIFHTPFHIYNYHWPRIFVLFIINSVILCTHAKYIVPFLTVYKWKLNAHFLQLKTLFSIIKIFVIPVVKQCFLAILPTCKSNNVQLTSISEKIMDYGLHYGFLLCSGVVIIGHFI